jgi:hypothetical protein
MTAFVAAGLFVMAGVGALLGVLGLTSLATTERSPSLDRVWAGAAAADESTARGFVLLPSVAVYPMEDGRTAWGLSLAMDL